MSDTANVNKAVKMIANLSIDAASRVLSKMVKAGATIELEKAYVADISEVTSKVTSEADEVVGAYIDLVGDAPFKFLFFVRPEDSMILTDLMLQKEIGSTNELDIYTRSVVQELGNVLASAVTNVFAKDFEIKMKPTPPIMIHDYAGTVFEEYIMQSGVERNELFVIESRFCIVSQDLKCYMFIVPMEGSETVLSYLMSSLTK